MTRDEMRINISLEDLPRSWSPFMDVCATIDKILEQTDGEYSDGVMVEMRDKLRRAMKPLEKFIKKIEDGNPDKFG